MLTAQSQARLAAALTVLLGALPALTGQSPSVLKDVRFWSSRGATRVALETSVEARFEYNRLRNPDRVYVDLLEVRPTDGFRGLSYTVPVNDGVVRQIRVAPNRTGVTRVVLDLDVAVEVRVNQLTNPDRVLVEVQQLRTASGDEGAETATGTSRAPAITVVPTPTRSAPSTQAPPVAASAKDLPTVIRPTAAKPYRPPAAIPIPPQGPLFDDESRVPTARGTTETGGPLPSHRTYEKLAVARPAPPPPRRPAAPPETAAAKPARPARVPENALEPQAAAPNHRGSQSLTRALGLKLNRVVLDAGHGGKDQGTATRSGLLEKELVLDITLRLGKLLERNGIEVLYTRTRDIFIPLEKRTEIANQSRADLFLSIHANSSSSKQVAGSETYYLSFTGSPVDMELAARENAASEKSIHELQDLVRQIAEQDKLEESREFAAKIQTASHELATKLHGRLRNRGVKKAPLVVLIGASMPAVLTEIGFISNPKEEANLKRADHRERIAEALSKGILDYSQTLSHFRVARRAWE